MAKKRSKEPLGRRLTVGEAVAGWLYLPLYLVGLSILLQKLFLVLHLPLNGISINVTYFTVNLVFVLLAFHNFLRQSYFGGDFWNFVQALILGFVLYYAGNFLITLAIEKLHGSLTVYNNDTVLSLADQSYYVMLAATVLAAPIVEETLLRGVVFGSLHSTSRVLAYGMSCLIFVLMHNWQYFAYYPAQEVLLSCLPYIPAAIALCWTYEKGRTIWASITLHALINAISFGVLTVS